MKEAYPLAWPEGWPRTSIRDREDRRAWKNTERKAVDALELELKRFSAFATVISRKDPHDVRGAMDPSVAIYFSRRREDDFSWQQALGIHNPDPTVDEINTSFRRLAAQHHPDKGGDIETFHALDNHRKSALAYVGRLEGRQPDFVIACDKFKEFRWNIDAIRHTIHSLRQMERDGTSRLLERAMAGFAALEAPRAEAVNATA